MLKPLLVIVSGAPASGKTTLARRLARDLHLPYVGKDDIKETLFDTLGWKDREWSRQLGIATYHLLYYFVEVELRAGRSFVVESNFRPAFDNARFLALQQAYDFEPYQILCQAENQVLLERIARRARSGERHPGHVDDVLYEEIRNTDPQSGYDALDIGGPLMRVDTTELERVDYASIIEPVRALLRG